MNKNDKIPIVKGSSFSRHYLKDDLIQNSPVIANNPFQQFEIHQRCTWKNTIQPHRLDFYLVFLVTEGEGVHRFGLQDHYIRKNMLCFVGPHMISSWTSEADEHRGYFCTFSDDFFNTGREDKQFLQTLPFFQIDGNGVLCLTNEQAQYYLTLFSLMQKEYENKNEYSDNILRSQLHVLLNKAHSQFLMAECPVHVSDHAGLHLVKMFTTAFMRDLNRLREGNGIHIKKVGEYAKEIGVSQNHLNDTVKTMTGKSAGQLIKDQLIKQATMCLKHSTKSISEIAYALGFEDPSYFSRYYKLRTGQSPSEFR
jgi:AraC family transcriptional activator of pobA